MFFMDGRVYCCEVHKDRCYLEVCVTNCVTNTEIITKPQSLAAERLPLFDPVRNIVMLSVVLYHAVAAYSTMVPWWAAHDNTTVLADLVRQVFDVYMMPVFFFIAGYFAVSTLQKKGLGAFIADKLKRLGIPWLLVMLTIVPLSVYSQQMRNAVGEGVPDFWNYLITTYLGSFGTVGLGNVPVGQMHLWYISLLIVFFIIFGLIYQMCRIVKGLSISAAALESPRKKADAASIMRALLLFSVVLVGLALS